jgi:hypothetical protein
VKRMAGRPWTEGGRRGLRMRSVATACAVAIFEAKKAFGRVSTVGDEVVECEATKTFTHCPPFEDLSQ